MALLIGVYLLTRNFPGRAVPAPLDYSEFKAKIRSGEVRRVGLEDGLLTGYPDAPASKSGNKDSSSRRGKPPVTATPIGDPGLLPLLDSMRASYYAKPSTDSGPIRFMLTWVLPPLFFLAVFRFFMPRAADPAQGLMNLGKSRAHVVSVKDVGVTFADVAGVDEAKEELGEVIDFLKQPEKYAAVGGKIPKGVLLVGPPGTGKTLLAKAIAGEAKVPFYSISGAEFVELIVGVGAARVRDMFKEARAHAPCIVFIDELDAIGKSRTVSLVGNDEREQTLNQLLVEMQGFESQAGVIVLAATNRPDVLDPALLRPGRFDRQILVDRPDLEGREAILKRHALKVALDPSVDLCQIAQRTPGFVGADLANLINEAALLAVRGGREKVLPRDLEDAIEKALSGLKKKSRLINPREKETVAYHETGHALTAELTPGADKVDKISVIPRGFGALGFTLQMPAGDRYLMTESELLAKVDVLLGGRIAEEVACGEASTGAANDLSQATEIVRQMLVEHGMSGKFRDVALHATRTDPVRRGFQEPAFQREYSEATQKYIDEEIAAIIRKRAEKVRALLQSRKETLVKVAKELMRVESLSGDAFRELIRETARLPVPMPAVAAGTAA